jgi:hypothetical protein
MGNVWIKLKEEVYLGVAYLDSYNEYIYSIKTVFNED